MLNIAIIPARGGSKRFPQKNLQLLGGVPLIAHSILYAKAQQQIHQIYVSTDDAAIKEVALAYGALVVDRPKELAGDFEPTITALQHVLQQLKEPVDNVVVLQPTNPLRPKELFCNAMKIFQEKALDSLFTVSRNHHKLGKIQNGRFVPYNYQFGQRSQDLEPLFYENGLLYLAKAQTIVNGQLMTPDAYPWLVEHPFGTVDIDTQEDLVYAEFLLNKSKNERKN